MPLIYILQSVHLQSGERSDLPWRFDSMEEAQAKARDMAAEGYQLLVRLQPVSA